MSGSLFEEGGPHNIRREDGHTYKADVRLPPDASEMVGRECVSEECSPAYFKIKPGTGLPGVQQIAFCPYCRAESDPNSFATGDQKRYSRETLLGEATDGIHRMLAKALGVGTSGKRKLGDGMLSIEMSLTSDPRRSVPRPLEEELRRDLVCSSCTLEHAVFGLATWCPDCGADVFLQHVHEELSVTTRILNAVPDRRRQLGARVAARDIENSLEDIVSVFETSLKYTVRRYLQKAGHSPLEIDSLLEQRVRNSFQNVMKGAAMFREMTTLDLLDGTADSDIALLTAIFEKRHPITHNLGIIDRKYLRNATAGELKGREVRVTGEEVAIARDIAEGVIGRAYAASTSTL